MNNTKLILDFLEKNAADKEKRWLKEAKKNGDKPNTVVNAFWMMSVEATTVWAKAVDLDREATYNEEPTEG